MEDAILLLTSLRLGGMETMKAVFLYPCVYICLCVVSVLTCEIQTHAQIQSQGNETFFISCVCSYICVCIYFDVVHTCIFLRLHLRRTCEPGVKWVIVICPFQNSRCQKQFSWHRLLWCCKQIRWDKPFSGVKTFFFSNKSVSWLLTTWVKFENPPWSIFSKIGARKMSKERQEF